MANLERTAYPRFPRVITTRDLLRHYTPDVDEVEWASGFARSDTGRLGLIVLLKTFHQLHYFPALENVPAEIISHIRPAMNLKPATVADFRGPKTLYRHSAAVRRYSDVQLTHGNTPQRIQVRAPVAASEVHNPAVSFISECQSVIYTTKGTTA